MAGVAHRLSECAAIGLMFKKLSLCGGFSGAIYRAPWRVIPGRYIYRRPGVAGKAGLAGISAGAAGAGT